MRKLILKMSISIDGFVGGPNGEIDWLLKSIDAETTNWLLSTIWNAGVHIMGSRTFNDMASFWPYSTEPLAAPMNEIPKVVFSKKGLDESLNPGLTTAAYRDATLLRTADGSKHSFVVSPAASTWKDARVATGDLATEIMFLKQQTGNDILAHGGASFAQSLAALGIIDEYQLLTHPVALGAGLPLFSSIPKALELKLINLQTFNSGAVAHTYHKA
jgi:dihydrofolate reductase